MPADLDALSDAEIVRLAATLVMKWEIRIGPSGNVMVILPDDSRLCLEHVYGCQPARIWNPLEDDADAFDLVDAMLAVGWRFALTLTSDPPPRSGHASFWKGSRMLSDDYSVAIGSSRRRAITLAAIKALQESL